jgi:hypothetical protein
MTIIKKFAKTFDPLLFLALLNLAMAALALAREVQP